MTAGTSYLHLFKSLNKEKLDLTTANGKVSYPHTENFQNMNDQHEIEKMSEIFLSDQLRVMVMQESTTYHCPINYLSENKCGNYGSIQNVMTDEYRRRICGWCYNIVDHFEIDRDVVYIAMTFFDRYLSFHSKENKIALIFCEAFNSSNDNCSSLEPVVYNNCIELIAVTALFVATKTHNINNSPEDKVTISDFVHITGGKFTEEIVEKTELELISVLKWRLNPPTITCFIKTFLDLIDFNHLVVSANLHNPSFQMESEFRNVININPALYEVARYFAELSVSRYDLAVLYKPSSVALATISIAIDTVCNFVGNRIMSDTLISVVASIFISSPYINWIDWQNEVFQVKGIMVCQFCKTFPYSSTALDHLLHSIMPIPRSEMHTADKIYKIFEESPVNVALI